MSWDDGLSGAALKIASAEDARLRVVAGPGTGKSFALQRRVAKLLEQGQDPKRILVVTFTRNAAASLVNDLRELDVPGCNEVDVTTLHSYCFRLLNREEVFRYLGRKPRTIVTFSSSGSLQFEGGTMLSDLMQSGDFGDKRECTRRIRAFEAAWARLQAEQPGWPENSIDRMFEDRLVAWLRFHQAMLVGELVPEALRFLRNNPMANAFTAFDHIIVDEYQDLNRAEQEIVDLLSENCSASIVGDPDQSIYGFRHANPEGIADYPNRHSNLVDFTLTECRRCPERVVKIANSLISNNYHPSEPPRLHAMAGRDKGEVHIVQWLNTEAEAEGLARYTRYLIDYRAVKPHEIMIICPRRKLAYTIRDAIRQHSVDLHSFYQEEALEKKSAQESFALLTLLNDPQDRIALRWWLGLGGAMDRSPSYAKLREHCEETGDTPRDALEKIDTGTVLLKGITPLLERYRTLKEIMAKLGKLDLLALIDELFSGDEEDCAIFRETAVLLLESNPDTKLRQLHDDLRTYVTHPEMPHGEFARIMSPQKTKGLTSKIVIVTDCIEGLFPTINTERPLQEQRNSLLEQRRLFYVALTRATDVLILSSATRIERRLAKSIGVDIVRYWGNVVETRPSRFLDELGPDRPRTKTGYDWENSGYR